MSILTENIKLYNPLNNRFMQFNSCILVILFLFIFLSAGDYQNKMPEALSGNNQPFFPIMFYLFLSMFYFGAMIAIIQAEVMTKPFASCLPSLHRISAMVVLLSGLIANLIYLAVFIYLPAPTSINGLLYYTSIFACGLLFYFMAAYFTLYVQFKRERAFLAIFTTFFLVCLISVMTVLEITYSLDSLLLYISIPILLLCIWSLYALLKMIVNPDFKRSLILNPNLFNLSFSAHTTAQIREIYTLRKLSSSEEKESPISRLLLSRLENQIFLSINKSIIARIYSVLDRYYTINKKYLSIRLTIYIIIISIFLCLTGYQISPMGYEKSHEFMIFYFTKIIPLFCILIVLLFPCSFIVLALNPEKNNHLFPEGRSEHFCSSLIICLLKPVIVVAWMSLAILTANAIKDYIPGFTLAEISFNYVGPDFSLILWALIIIPAMNIFIYYDEKPCSLITLLVFLAVLLALSLYSIFGLNPFYASIAMALAIVISNGFFIDRLWRYWFKKDIELLD